MLIELNRFFTTPEVRKEYRLPEFLADEILPNLPVVAKAEDGTRFHLEKEVDEFLSEYSKQHREKLVIDELVYGPILVSKTRRETTINGKTYPLDGIYLDVLACLIGQRGGWVTRRDMQEYSSLLEHEGRLDRVIKTLTKSITVLNELIKSSPRGYRIDLGEKME